LFFKVIRKFVKYQVIKLDGLVREKILQFLFRKNQYDFSKTDSQKGHVMESPSCLKGTSTDCFAQFGHLENPAMNLRKNYLI